MNPQKNIEEKEKQAREEAIQKRREGYAWLFD
jgi:hypothetical protein